MWGSSSPRGAASSWSVSVCPVHSWPNISNISSSFQLLIQLLQQVLVCFWLQMVVLGGVFCVFLLSGRQGTPWHLHPSDRWLGSFRHCWTFSLNGSKSSLSVTEQDIQATALGHRPASVAERVVLHERIHCPWVGITAQWDHNASAMLHIECLWVTSSCLSRKSCRFHIHFTHFHSHSVQA